jgi:hypothetical protein
MFPGVIYSTNTIENELLLLSLFWNFFRIKNFFLLYRNQELHQVKSARATTDRKASPAIN